MNAVDTNVLFYARDPRDPGKREIAAEVIASLDDAVLLWQVACEYLAVSRKLESYGYSRVQAVADIADMRRVWSTAIPGWTTLDRAEHLRAGRSLSFWDALLVAACLDAGVNRLYSEDFQSTSRFDSLEIVNPFE
jgi:predicted nucleic acid-binding protein